MNPARSSESKGRARKAGEVARYFRRLNSGETPPYRLTASGAWAASRPSHLFDFFSRIDLSRFRLFVDLGSGDGVACCVAGLFTTAVGVESDPFLISRASAAARDLQLGGRVRFIRADFFTQGIRNADCLYIYPDRPLHALEDVLAGWGGTLLVYGPHFPLRRFRIREKLKRGRELISVYFDPGA